MSILETLNKNKLRITTGVIVGVIGLSCVIMGGIPLMILAMVFSFWCSKEWVQILNYKGFYPFLSVILSVNIIFALLVKGIIMILGIFGIANMWLAVFADVGVSVIAILNAMRCGRID